MKIGEVVMVRRHAKRRYMVSAETRAEWSAVEMKADALAWRGWTLVGYEPPPLNGTMLYEFELEEPAEAVIVGKRNLLIGELADEAQVALCWIVLPFEPMANAGYIYVLDKMERRYEPNDEG